MVGIRSTLQYLAAVAAGDVVDGGTGVTALSAADNINDSDDLESQLRYGDMIVVSTAVVCRGRGDAYRFHVPEWIQTSDSGTRLLLSEPLEFQVRPCFSDAMASRRDDAGSAIVTG